MLSVRPLEPPVVPDEADQRVLMHGVSYRDYEMMLLLRGDRPVPRIAFAEGVLELMSPSRNHEALKKTLARLLEAYAEERDLDLNGFGSWTLKNPTVERGAEPDECYALGPRREVPDLVIEVVWTHGGLDKLKLYAQLGVPEVWMWRRGQIEVHRLEGEAYTEEAQSALIPELDLEHLASFLGAESQTAAVRAYRASLGDDA
jgi:Uma2 family endonuclease